VNANSIFNVLGGIVTVALVTTLVLPGRQTPAVFTALSNGFIGAIKVAQGR